MGSAQNMLMPDLQRVKRELETALRDAEAYCDPTNKDCGIDPEVRKVSRLYVSSWVIQPIENALALINKNIERKGRLG